MDEYTYKFDRGQESKSRAIVPGGCRCGHELIILVSPPLLADPCFAASEAGPHPRISYATDR